MLGHKHHGLSNTPIWKAWRNMRDRCSRPGYKGYKNYGGRGIQVCLHWRNSFEAFYADMRPTWFEGAELHRENNDKNYTPGNCRWISKTNHQRLERRNTQFLTINGVKKTITQWAEESGISRSTLRSRIREGWSGDRLLTHSRKKDQSLTINGVTKLIVDWAKETGISSLTIRKRIRRGWTDQKLLAPTV